MTMDESRQDIGVKVDVVAITNIPFYLEFLDRRGTLINSEAQATGAGEASERLLISGAAGRAAAGRAAASVGRTPVAAIERLVSGAVERVATGRSGVTATGETNEQ